MKILEDIRKNKKDIGRYKKKLEDRRKEFVIMARDFNMFMEKEKLLKLRKMVIMILNRLRKTDLKDIWSVIKGD